MDTDGKKFQTWNILTYTNTNQPGAAISVINVEKIISMTVPKIRIPFNQSIVQTGYNRVSLLIKEFASQSIVAQEGRNYHFMFDIEVEASAINLIPLQYGDQNGGHFEFTKPLTQVDTITLTWGNPLELVEFNADRMKFVVDYFNPARFTATQPHNNNTGDLMIILQYKT
jgi:hypothetical protein